MDASNSFFVEIRAFLRRDRLDVHFIVNVVAAPKFFALPFKQLYLFFNLQVMLFEPVLVDCIRTFSLISLLEGLQGS